MNPGPKTVTQHSMIWPNLSRAVTTGLQGVCVGGTLWAKKAALGHVAAGETHL